MFTIEAHRLGGAAANKVCFERAKKLYYESPNHCLNCATIIPVTKSVHLAKKKKFCNRSCAASFNNKKFKKRQPTPHHICPYCGGHKSDPIATRCRACELLHQHQAWVKQTKGSLISKRKNWQSFRNGISKHARLVFLEADIKKSCYVCGYEKHTQVAHRKSVSEFPDSATIAEINALDNLLALCPNHHWEYDHGLLIL